jgi:hypothetical protein
MFIFWKKKFYSQERKNLINRAVFTPPSTGQEQSTLSFFIDQKVLA